MTEFAKKIKLQCVFASDAIDTNSFAHASKGFDRRLNECLRSTKLLARASKIALNCLARRRGE